MVYVSGGTGVLVMVGVAPPLVCIEEEDVGVINHTCVSVGSPAEPVSVVVNNSWTGLGKAVNVAIAEPSELIRVVTIGELNPPPV